MANAIGLAGWEIGVARGRVAAFTKAINSQDLSNPAFNRLFLNSLHWSARRNSSNIILLSSENSSFDNLVVQVLQSAGYSTIVWDRWYSFSGYPGGLGGFESMLLLPSYNPFGGTRMPDSGQLQILNEVRNGGMGLVISEWFHYLQSLPSKRSFSLTSNVLLGLHEISPIVIEDYVTYSDPDKIVFSKNIEQDSISYNLPEQFTVDAKGYAVGYDGTISQISTVKTNATIFTFTDVFARGTTTTTTTTTIAPARNIKFKVADVNLIDYCGPHVVTMGGPDADYFLLENNELFLTENTGSTGIYSVTVSVDDLFNPKRFNTIQKTYNLELARCDPPISKPLDGSGPAFSYRGLSVNGSNMQTLWGQQTPYGVISPFIDFSLNGEGSPDDPIVSWLGGQHGDTNALWLQINKSGLLNWNLRVSSELNRDYASVWIVSASGAKASQHTQQYNQEYINLAKYKPLIPTLSTDASFIFATSQLTGSATSVGSRTIDIPLDDTIKTFLVVTYSKDEKKSINEDKIHAQFFIGTTTTTTTTTTSTTPAPTTSTTTTTTEPPPNYTYTLNFVDNITRGSISPLSLSVVFPLNGSVFMGYVNYFSDEAGYYFATQPTVLNALAPISFSHEPWNQRIWFYLNGMPENGGSQTIIIQGQTVPTTTTSTTTTTTTLRPCDNLIYVLCKQTLKCSKAGSSCLPNLSSSTNEVVLDSCCDLTQAEMLARFVSEYGNTPSVQFGDRCPTMPTSAFSDCPSVDSAGNCQDIINYETLATISCNLSLGLPPDINPLP
jgi:hypothetical protein